MKTLIVSLFLSIMSAHAQNQGVYFKFKYKPDGGTETSKLTPTENVKKKII